MWLFHFYNIHSLKELMRLTKETRKNETGPKNFDICFWGLGCYLDSFCFCKGDLVLGSFHTILRVS